jgi:Ran GTPase-activating protein (RanGAP) involved in mRNA processing and transport
MAHGRKLGAALASSSRPELIEVSLQVNNLGDEGVEEIVQALMESESYALETLDLSSNDLTSPTLQVITDYLFGFHRLKTLFLAANKGIEDVTPLVKALRSGLWEDLESIDLSDCGLTGASPGVEELLDEVEARRNCELTLW